jgi:predicted MFS family arabinose efflux permease
MEKTNDNKIKLTRGLIVLMAITCGVTVANITYNQPLLDYMASYFEISRGNIGLVSTFTQIGYGFGMLFIIPIGDIKERKSLIISTLTLCIFSLVTLSFSMNFYWLLASSFLLGFSSVITQLIIPFAASLSEPNKRGRVIGTIVSGLITGIILARLISGFLGARLGWRAVYILAIFIVTTLTLVLKKFLPESPPKSNEKYKDIMKSMASILKTNPVVRSSSIIGPFIFGSFQLFWTSIVFYLESPVYQLTRSSSEIAGQFSLVGIIGIFLVPMVGTLSDRRNPRFVIGLSAALALSAFVIMTLFGENILGLIVGIMLLDFSVNASQVSNQTRINSVESPRQSRFNSVFMSIYFFVGSLGSFLGSYTFSKFGWIGVCITGIVFVSISLLTHFTIGKTGYIEGKEY